MEVKEKLKLNIKSSLESLGLILDVAMIDIDNSKDINRGDYASNVALKNSKALGKNPRELANEIVNYLDMSEIEKAEIAGPGFINFFMKKDSLTNIISKIIDDGDNFGRGENKNKKIDVEFVSANPTGLLHVGTARGAAIGDSISRLLAFNGYEITKEYYINDAGVQIKHLGESIIERYKELLGLPFLLPEDGYHGEDIIDVAKKIKNRYGDNLLERKDCLSFFMEEGMKIELDRIKEHLETFRVTFDVFSSEKVVRSNDAIEKEIEYLKPYTYQKDGALFLKTTDYLDDKDRVIVKSDGEYTYFMPDIVYHVNKMSRGFDQLIDVLGADHHGYINRMKSALMMHGYPQDTLEIELIQMVRFIKNGEEFKASKRSGDAITLHEICEEVGVDAMRYFFAMRSHSTHMDFDMDLAKEQSSNNPVYYAQYAHARLCSILNSLSELPIDKSASHLAHNSELALVKQLSLFPDVVNSAASERAPYKITNYIHDVAEKVHSFYTECHVKGEKDVAIASSRLALCLASKIVLKNALSLVGVSAPERM